MDKIGVGEQQKHAQLQLPELLPARLFIPDARQCERARLRQRPAGVMKRRAAAQLQVLR